MGNIMILTDMGEELATELFNNLNKVSRKFYRDHHITPESGDVIIDYLQIRGRMDIIEDVEFDGLWDYIEEERSKVLGGKTESIVIDYFNTVSNFDKEKIVIQVGMHGQNTFVNQYLFNDVRKTLDTYTPKTIRMIYESYSMIMPGSKTYIPSELVKHPVPQGSIIPLPPKEEGYFIYGYHPKYGMPPFEIR